MTERALVLAAVLAAPFLSLTEVGRRVVQMSLRINMISLIRILVVVAVPAIRSVGAVEVRVVVVRTVLGMLVLVGVAIVVQNVFFLIILRFTLFQVRIQRLTRASI